MIEIIIKQYSDNHLSVPCYLEKPITPPQRYVLFEKISSGKSNHLPSSTFAFQSYAESMYESALLNEKVKEVIESMIELDEIRSIKLNSDYNFTDKTIKEYRYQAVFDIKHY